MPNRGHEPLDQIVAAFPGLREVMKFYTRERFVPVRLGTITTPKGMDGVYRTDCKVRGLYVVDRAELRRAKSDTRIKQDYLVAWLDEPSRAPDYYSGKWRDMPKDAALYLRDIATYCAQIGVLGQYGCDDDLGHHYAGPDDSRLQMEDPWPAAFRDAWREALALEGMTEPA